jgi:hypothetical protein
VRHCAPETVGTQLSCIHVVTDVRLSPVNNRAAASRTTAASVGSTFTRSSAYPNGRRPPIVGRPLSAISCALRLSRRDFDADSFAATAASNRAISSPSPFARSTSPDSVTTSRTPARSHTHEVLQLDGPTVQAVHVPHDHCVPPPLADVPQHPLVRGSPLARVRGHVVVHILLGHYPPAPLGLGPAVAQLPRHPGLVSAAVLGDPGVERHSTPRRHAGTLASSG